jgi:hypothetical protein
MLRIKNSSQVMTGIFLISVSILAFYLSWRFRTFSELGIGVGFVPRMFASVQLLLGLLLVLSGIFKESEHKDDDEGGWQIRPLIVLVAIVWFGVTIESMGLVIAIVGLILISCTANKGTSIFEALALAAGAALFSVLIFVKALGLVIPVWPANLWGG